MGKKLAVFPEENDLVVTAWTPSCTTSGSLERKVNTINTITTILMQFTFSNQIQQRLLQDTLTECMQGMTRENDVEEVKALKCQHNLLLSSDYHQFDSCMKAFFSTYSTASDSKYAKILLPSFIPFAVHASLVDMTWSTTNRMYCYLNHLQTHSTVTMMKELKILTSLKWMEMYILGQHASYQFSVSTEHNTPEIIIEFSPSICTYYYQINSNLSYTTFSLEELLENLATIETMVMKFPDASPNIKDVFVRVIFFLKQLQNHANSVIIPTYSKQVEELLNMETWKQAGMKSIREYVNRNQVSYSSTIISTLLAMGAIEVSGIHAINLLQYEKQLISQSFQKSGDEFADDTTEDLVACVYLYYSLQHSNREEIESHSKCKLLLQQVVRSVVDTFSDEQKRFFGSFFFSTKVGTDLETTKVMLFRELEKMLEASLSFRMLLLFNYLLLVGEQWQIVELWESLVSNEQLYQIIISVVSQIYNPVVLSVSSEVYSTGPLISDKVMWIKEILLLRIIFVNMIEKLKNVCDATGSDGQVSIPRCWVDDHILSSVNRGLFLEAYQGMGLIANFHKQFFEILHGQTDLYLPHLPAWLYDGHTTSLYQQFMHTFAIEEAVSFDSSTIVKAEETAADTRVVSIAFVCNSVTRHSVGRLLSRIIAGFTDASHNKDVQYDVYLITSSPHPHNSEQYDQDASSMYDDISYYLADKISPSRWVAYPTVSTSMLDPKTSTIILHPKWQSFISYLKETVRLQVAVFTDVLMQPVQMIWSQHIRLAPAQVVFWGHPFSTGNHPHMDYFVTSDSFEPRKLRTSR